MMNQKPVLDTETIKRKKAKLNIRKANKPQKKREKKRAEQSYQATRKQ